MAAKIMVQQLDANNDPIEGPNGPVFLEDIDAVTQIITTRLRLLLGEWWEDLTIGFPLFQIKGSSGSPTSQKASLLAIQQTIRASPYVLNIASFTFSRVPSTRQSSFRAIVVTAFGNIIVTNAPGTSATVPTQ